MKNPVKKPPARVLSLDGNELPLDKITDADYEAAIGAQETVLLAQGEERKILGRLRIRIERGAIESSGEYYFDKRLGIVRSIRKKKKA